MNTELRQDPNNLQSEVTTYNFENLDIYLRNFFFYHLSKTYLGSHSLFHSFRGTFLGKNIFKQIIQFGSYERHREMLMKIVRSDVTSTLDEK